jgi:ubiquinone/menaquinone biosynthesis C-methylase UbiE
LQRGLGRLEGNPDVAVEVGSGIGTYSGLLASRFRTVLSVDLSLEMLSRANPTTLRVRADGGCLPVRDGSVDAIVLINAFAFPDEIDRVIPPGGRVLWVNSSGAQTPIYLSTEDLVRALPFAVIGFQSRAGAGTWCAVKRL